MASTALLTGVYDASVACLPFYLHLRRCRHYPGHSSASRRRGGRWVSRRSRRAGYHRPRREEEWWHIVIYGTIFSCAALDRLRAGRLRLPHHLANRPPLWLARAGSGRRGCGRARSGAGLPIHGKVSRVGGLHSRSGARPGNLGDLPGAGLPWARHDAAGCRPVAEGPAGPPAMGGQLTFTHFISTRFSTTTSTLRLDRMTPIRRPASARRP